MRLILLADHQSSHTLKWVKSLADHFQEIVLISFNRGKNPELLSIKNLTIYYFSFDIKNNFSKLKYLFSYFKIKKILKSYNPDILHSHYATSYGLLGALQNFHPFVISVWGSDIFDFPHKSLLNAFILKRILNRADCITSTSKIMTLETRKFTSKKIKTIPFGIDRLASIHHKSRTKDKIVIGIIKSLKPIYNIELLINVFSSLLKVHKNLKLQLDIIGSGSEESKLKDLTRKLKINQHVIFYGKIPHSDVPDYLKNIDIFVNPSLHESFGVSILEASSAGIPVIASRVGGLTEVVVHGKTGYLFNLNNPDELFMYIEKLILDPELRNRIGEEGQIFVQCSYAWDVSIELMLKMYKELLM